MNRDLILASLREAVVTMLAALATMACALALDPEPGPAILGVVLCLSLSRSQLDRDRRGRIEAAIALPVVSVAALGVGLLLQALPWTQYCLQCQEIIERGSEQGLSAGSAPLRRAG